MDSFELIRFIYELSTEFSCSLLFSIVIAGSAYIPPKPLYIYKKLSSSTICEVPSAELSAYTFLVFVFAFGYLSIYVSE